MNSTPTSIPDLLLIEPRVFDDERGFFYESFNEREFLKKVKSDVCFVQDNHSRSLIGVIRGLHYQTLQPQGKLVRVMRGSIFDVAVDLRKNSPTFGQWEGMELSEKNKYQLWIPPGFAHGFLTLSEDAEILYKTTNYYAPEYERTILWNDATLNIRWPITREVKISDKDRAGVSFTEAELF
ncbi:MAG: dTDP-4-dehydrorhamnose 3,5-epimerase [Chthoniobacterales bacterium]